MPGETLALIVLASLLAWVLGTHRMRRWPSALAAPPLRVTRLPSLSVIRPLKGLDSELPKNLEAALVHDYPGDVETLFVVDDEREPALALVRRAIEQHGGDRGRSTACVVYAGEPPPGRTGKLNAMIAGLERARGEVIVFADSDTRPSPDALTTLVETLLSRADAAAAFAPVVVTSHLQTVGDVGYALLLNGLYGPMAGRSARRAGGTMPFIMGQFMAWRREALEAVGGLEAAEGQLVDDMFLGMMATTLGWVNVVSPQSVPIIQSGLGFRDFLGVYVRWITFSRSGLPALGFKGEGWFSGLAFWTGAVLAPVGLLSGSLLVGVAAGTLALTVVGSMEALHLEHGGARIPLRLGWMSAMVMLLAPFVMLRTLGHREVEWRGRYYRLDAGARLATGRHERHARCAEVLPRW